MLKDIFCKKHQIISLLLCTVLLFSVALSTVGCKAKETEKIKVKVVALPYVGYSVFFIAQEKGYFAEEDLEVEFVKFPTITQAIPLLAQGELDVAAGPVSASLINAIINSANLKIVAGRDYVPLEGATTQFIVNKALYESGELDEIIEIKERKVAVPSIGALLDHNLSVILGQVGLTLNDVELEILNPQNAIAALGNQAVAAAMLGQTQLAEAVRMGYGIPIPPLEPVLPGFQEGFVCFGSSLLEKNPAAGEKFLRAYLKGCRIYLEGKTESNLEIMAEYTGIDKDVILELITLYPVFPDGRIIVEDIMEFQQWLFDLQLIDTILSPSELIDDTLLNKALESME